MRINIDKAIINTIVGLFVLKLVFAYLNVEFGWWQRTLIPYMERYNFLGLPDSFGKKLEYIIIPLLYIYLFKNIEFLKRLSVIIMILFIMIILNILTSFYTETALILSLEYTIKLSAPILLFINLIIHYQKYSFDIKKLMIRLIIFCICLTIIGYLFLEGSYNHNKIWLPIYFSSVHTHSYVLVIICIGISYLLYEKRKFISFFLFVIAALIFLYFGHRVRTPMVLFLIYLIFTSFTIHNLFKAIWIRVLINIPLIVFLLSLFLVFSPKFDLNKYSSGRIAMYKAKYEMIKGYNAPELVLGRGKGSDFIVTDYWIRERKNSHNDLLTFLVENGTPYALLFVLIIFLLIIIRNKVNVVYLSILLGYFATSLLSNGLVLRPIASYFLFIVLAYIFIDTDDSRFFLKPEPK